MSAPAPTPPAPGLLTADARRSLALLAGGDLDAAAAPAARKLADLCPHCRGHLADVRASLAALGRCDPHPAAAGSLWGPVRAGLHAAPAAAPAREPAAKRWAMPAFAVTAAAALAGLFAFPPGDVLPGAFAPGGVVRPAADGQYLAPAPAEPRLAVPAPGYAAPAFRDADGNFRDARGRLLAPARAAR